MSDDGKKGNNGEDRDHSHGHGHGPGCGCGHDHGKPQPPHEPRTEAERAALAEISGLLREAGYDPSDGESFKQGAAALMVAQMVAVSAGLSEGTGTGPLSGSEGEGRSPELAGVRPGMLPRMTPQDVQADTAALGALFLEDGPLGQVRLDPARVAAYLEPHASRVPRDLAERDRWLARRARDFVSSEHERDGEKGATVVLLRGLKDSLLSAAQRYSGDDDRLRALALGLLYHSSWAPDLEAPHTLETLLFGLALRDTAVEQQNRARLLHSLADDDDGPGGRLAADSPEGARQWQEAFDELPEDQRVELLQTAERFHDSVVEEVASGSFPVPLPLVSVLPLVIETVAVARDGDDAHSREQAREVAMRHARDGLSPEDRQIFVALCDEWLESSEEKSDAQLESVRYARRLATVGRSSLEPLLLLSFLERNRVSPLEGEPTPDPSEGLEIDSPAFLERYGAFLAGRGELRLALRTWRLCRFAGEIPDSVSRLMEDAESKLE